MSECLARLDAVGFPAAGGIQVGDEQEITDNLQHFGDAAKQELLRRAGDADAVSAGRNLAGAILRYWGDWRPSDVPALSISLRLEHGGWTAWPLVEIGTRDAIQALVDDLVVIGPSSQTGGALKKLGARALPYLVPLLEDERHALQVNTVIHGMGAKALDEAANWFALAEEAPSIRKGGD